MLQSLPVRWGLLGLIAAPLVLPLFAMAPDRREAFLRSRNRLKQFNENNEILALAHYLDTVVVMVDGLTKNVAAAMTAHTEPMANLTAQLKRVAAELPSHANTLTPKTIRRWLACWAASILLVAPATFFWGWISAQREQSNRLAATLAEAPQMGPWVAAHGGWATFHPTKDEKGNLFHTLVIHLPGLQRTDVGTNDAGDGFMNLPD